MRSGSCTITMFSGVRQRRVPPVMDTLVVTATQTQGRGLRMEFRLLGRFEAEHDGRALPLGRRGERLLLAFLLLEPNTTVAVERLVELLWGDHPAGTARSTLHTYVSRLRKNLSISSGDVKLMRSGAGYIAEIDPQIIDVHRFRSLVMQARDLHDTHERSAALRAALALWRGPLLADVLSDDLRQRLGAPWEQMRLAALESAINAELVNGAHLALISELVRLTLEHPYHENFAAALMTALDRCGRHADALEVYTRLDRQLRNDLGIDPGREIQALHQRLLSTQAGGAEPSDGTEVVAAVAPAGPSAVGADNGPANLLPRSVPHFVGRAAELKELFRYAAQVGGRGAGPVVVISGMAGIGKTALVVRWAHEHAERFPDGQLYIDLQGFHPSNVPVEPTAAARRLLEALGIPPTRIPAAPDAQLDHYRAVLADKRILLILDNARDSAHVRPLLSGSRECLILVTSRNMLASLVALDGAFPINLSLLSTSEAKELMTRRLGAERIAFEAEASEELIGLCNGIPLALNLAAAHAVLRPRHDLDDLVQRLSDARRRLDGLTDEDPSTGMRSLFWSSYDALSTQAKRMFRLLGVHPGPDFTLLAAGSISALAEDQAAKAIDELVQAHMVIEHMPGRYTFHDLLRVYAEECSHENEREREAAVGRIIDHYLRNAHAVAGSLYPGWLPDDLPPRRPGVLVGRPEDQTAAIYWYRSEISNLIASVSAAAEAGFAGHGWQTARAAITFLETAWRWQEAADLSRFALEAAVREGNTFRQAGAHRWLGNALRDGGAFPEAQFHLERALSIHVENGDINQIALTHHGIAELYGRRQMFAEKLFHAKQALNIFQADGDEICEASTLGSVANAYRSLHDFEQTLSYGRLGVDLARKIGDRVCEASCLSEVAYALHKLGKYAESINLNERAAAICRATGSDYQLGFAYTEMGDSYAMMGDFGSAHKIYAEAIAIFDELKHPHADTIREKLSRLVLDFQVACADARPAPLRTVIA
jgi:DNA-binding SARP family transcriptional activator